MSSIALFLLSKGRISELLGFFTVLSSRSVSLLGQFQYFPAARFSNAVNSDNIILPFRDRTNKALKLPELSATH